MRNNRCKCGGIFQMYGEYRMCEECGGILEKKEGVLVSAGNVKYSPRLRSLKTGGPEKKWS